MDTRPTPPLLRSLIEQQRAALFLDFDGTLVELAQTPDAIVLRPKLAASLLALNERLEGRLALVSGRSIEDLAVYLGRLPIVMAGSHGASIEAPDGSTIGQSPQGINQAARNALRSFSKSAGLDLEEKSHGVALHFRTAPEHEAQALAFADQLAATHGLKAKRGKCVVEIIESGVDKGKAVDRIMAEPAFAGATPWFLGDDVTDEDGFAACIKHGGGAILVGEREKSCANHALAGVTAVHEWLEFE